MESIKSLAQHFEEKQIKAIAEAHSYSWAQVCVLSLVMSYISDIRHDRANTNNIENRTINLEGFFINGKDVYEFIKEIRFNWNGSKKYLYAIAKNFVRGTVHPLFEIMHDNKVKEFISPSFFDNEDQFDNFKKILVVIRHFLSHNYTETVILKTHDMKEDSTIIELKNNAKSNMISFKYDGTKYFPEIYGERKFEINISLNLSKVDIGHSLFDAVSITELFFLGELCNNILFKTFRTIQEIQKHNQ